MKTNPPVLAIAAVAILLSYLPLQGRPDRGEQHGIRELALQLGAAPAAPRAPAATPVPAAPSAPTAPAAPGSNPTPPPVPVVAPLADGVLPASPNPQKNQLRASQLTGLAVFSFRNEKLGDINDLIVDMATGRVSALIVAFDGRLAIVPLTTFHYDGALQLLQVDSTKSALKALPPQ